MGVIEITAPQLSGSGEILFGRELWDRQDWNSAMQSGQALVVYEKMRSTDGEIAGGLARLTAPLLSATWTVEAPEGEDPKTHEPTLLCRRAIFGEEWADPFSGAWTDTLRHALLMIAFGLSAFEKVWGVDSRGYQTIARFAPIMPATVFKFTFAEDARLESMTQRAWIVADRAYREVTIPASKLLLMTFGREGNNLFGRSALRTAWKHWHYKAALIEVDGIRHERWGTGVPWIETPAGETISQEEADAHESITKNLRTHEKQGVRLLPGRILHIEYPSGTQSNIIGSCEYHDQQESRSLFTEFMATGTAETGSRAVVASKMDMMMLALQGTGNLVETAFNRQVIPELVERNFGRKEAERPPRLQLEDMDKMSGGQKAEIIKSLASVGFIKPDKVVRGRIRDELDFPAEDEATLEEPPVQGGFGATTNRPDNAGQVPVEKAKPNGAAPSEKKPPAPVRMTFMGAEAAPIGSPVTLSREPFPHEMYCAFSEMKAYMRDEPQRIWHRVVEPFRKMLAARIASKAASAPDDKLAARDLGEMPGLRGRLEDELTAALLKVYRSGRATVLEERKRQLTGTPVSPPSVTLADPPDPDLLDPEFDITPTKEQKAWVGTLAIGFVGALLTSMVNEAARAGLAARQADVTGKNQEADILAAINALSVAVQQAVLSGAVTRTFGTGRSEQAAEMRDQITKEYYSAIMDDSTCPACAALDGAEHDPGDPTYETPNPNCEGAAAGNCRCETISVFIKEAA